MKKLKTFLCLLICLALMCGSLVACSSSSSKKKSSKKDSKIEKDEDDDEDEDDDDEDDDDDDDAKPTKKPSKNDDDDDDDVKPTKKPSKNDDDDDDTEPTKKPSKDDDDDKKPAASKDGELAVDEQVIYDDDEFKITVVSIKEDTWYGYGLELLLENNSDESVEFNCDYILVNNCVARSYLWETVKAGGKAYTTISLYTEDLYNNYGISNIGVIDFAISAENDDWDTVMETGPISIKTSLYDVMDESVPFDDGVEVINEDGIYMVAKMGKSDEWGTDVMIYCVNNTDTELYITSDYVTVNGFDVSAYVWMNIPAGATCVDSLSLYASTLEDSHIDEIESLSFALLVRDYETYDKILTTDEVEIPID